MFDLEYEMRARQEDAIRRANQERVVTIARTASSRRKPVFRQVISRIGRSLCRIGSWLDVRYGAASLVKPVSTTRSLVTKLEG